MEESIFAVLARYPVENRGTLSAPPARAALSDAEIRQTLERPIWAGRSAGAVWDRVRPGERTCIVVSDHTRKTGACRVLPALVDGLLARGCAPGDLSILFASGIHRRPRADEIVRVLGPAVAASFADRIFFHDADDASELVDVGATPRGHRVRLNRRAVEADRLILTGAASYHYHAGFGGGRKSLVPGLAARETIAWNHSLTLDPDADRIHPAVQLGNVAGNPVADEMMAGARLRPPDAIINTVLSPSGEIVGVFAGEMEAAHRAACALVERVSRVDIRETADLVIASAGAASNWVQSHKALFNASRAAGPSGRIVLVAPCPDGLGDEGFRKWVRLADVADIYRGLRRAPEVLGQTALSTRERGARTVLVTGLPPRDVADLGIETAPDLDAAVRTSLERLRGTVAGRIPSCYAMPEAMSVVPFLSP